MPESTANPQRPDPDSLLAQVSGDEALRKRGKLKVFFGMSAGVGKTYAMLEEARKRAAEGVDVLVGYAEPHIRPETEAVLVGLDILPYLFVEHRGATLKEFNLDAALARKPAVCCVDELAHTNPAGLRHPKRWQDVIELLDAGIDVYTTLNVQHLESVNDIVERITGVKVRETLPDAVFDAADDVELVDIAPGELLERFREGRVYKPEQAERASRHFFTKGNLMALRELALRKTAERVDEQMQQHRREQRAARVVPASEKVLVCIGPSPLSPRLARSARRLATALRASLVAVYVERPGAPPSASTRALVESNLRLAEELDAEVVFLSGASIADEVLAYATAHNVTKIVIGKPLQSRWKDLLLGSVVDDVIRNSGEIDIHVIRGRQEHHEKAPAAESTDVRGRWDLKGLAVALAATAAATAAGWPLHFSLGVANANILMLYLIGVLFVASRGSRTAAVAASLLAVLAFDIVFVPPQFSFAVADQQYVVTFAGMLLTALVISALTHRVRAQAEFSRMRERRTAALLSLSRDLASAPSAEQVAQAASRHIFDTLAAQTAVFVKVPARPLQLLGGSAAPHIDDKERGVAQWAFDHDQPAGRGTDTLPSAAATYVPLRGPRGVGGVLGVSASADDTRWSPERRQLIEAVALQTALAIERANIAEEARAAWERVEAEFLRNTLLSGVSHELRTPLAGITGAATALAASDGALAEPARREMLDTVIAEAERMERLINNLLDMTRMESGGLVLRKEWMPIDEPVAAALQHLDRRLADRPIRTCIAPDLPLAHIDATAVEQVIANLLDNAVEYTPPGSPIDLTVSRAGGALRIEVADSGPGLPPGAEKRVFDKFFRGGPRNGAPSRGVGLGLAICRGIVESHGGAISASNRDPHGAAFSFLLPIGGTPPAVDASA